MQIPLKTALPFLGVFLLGAVASGLICFFLLRPGPVSSIAYGTPLRDVDSNFDYVAPLLACNVSAQLESPELHKLKTELTDIVNNASGNNGVEIGSVYYRDLNSGMWTSVNVEEKYTPASLMKVPIYMAYMKQSEGQPGLLGVEITVDEDPAPNMRQDIPPEETVEIGETYSIDELLQMMIRYSDNRATYILTDYLDPTIFEEIFGDLGVPSPATTNPDDFGLDVRLYSRFFRILYNATFLTDDQSDYALRLLTQTTFKDGLVAGVPEDLKVAHKFGEAPLTLPNGSKGHELHDCGIVYTDEPYLICVMTKGESTEELENLISSLSQAAYDFQIDND